MKLHNIDIIRTGGYTINDLEKLLKETPIEVKGSHDLRLNIVAINPNYIHISKSSGLISSVKYEKGFPKKHELDIYIKVLEIEVGKHFYFSFKGVEYMVSY